MGKRRYRIKLRFFLNIIVLLVLLGAVTVTAAGYTLYKNVMNGTIIPGIFIDEISMEGLSKEQAYQALYPLHMDKLAQIHVELAYEQQRWVLNSETLYADTNIRSLIEQAYHYGREGNWLARLIEVKQSEKRPVYLSLEVTYPLEDLTAFLNEIDAALRKEPRNATIEFRPEDQVKFVKVPEESGWGLDKETVLSRIQEALSAGENGLQISLHTKELAPSVYLEDLPALPERLVRFGTDLSRSAPDRTHNVLKAASAFNGLIAAPGEVISFNEVVGERTLERGYRNAPMIVADKSLRDAPGGGVSQTSTTLYNAAIRAGLEAVAFHRHSFPVAYIDKGLDTTVNLPSPELDLKIKNVKAAPIYIRTYHADQKVYFEIYGEPLPNGQTIRITTEEYEIIPAPEAERLRDETARYVVYEDEIYEHVVSRDGYKVKVYREIIENGTVVQQEILDDHYYRPIAGILYIGVTKRPAELPAPPAPTEDPAVSE